jgi:hypothetical protein
MPNIFSGMGAVVMGAYTLIGKMEKARLTVSVLPYFSVG